MEYLKNIYVLLFALTTMTPNLPMELHPTKIAANTSFKKSDVAYSALVANNLKLPSIECFNRAFDGFYLLQQAGKIKNNILTIVDFSLSSTEKRMWVIDMNENKVLFQSLVAHGQNSGGEFAENFSNENESYKSSLGFFTTAEVYNGAHGMSLKLDGLEKGINDKARQRAIVIHGADYVSTTFIQSHSRLGRSHGCPALPVKTSKEIINKIKGNSCLFIYHPSQSYFSKSTLVS